MSRLEAAKILTQLIGQERSLSDLRKELSGVNKEDKPLVQELCYGVARWYEQLDFILSQILKKPLKQKDIDVYSLLLIGLYQLSFTRIPNHAAINETVAAARKLHKEWATKLINAVLREYLRNKEAIEAKIKANEDAYYSHPAWLINKIKSAWPCFESILEANNQYPPFCLRVNCLKTSREAYLSSLAKLNIKAEPIPFTQSGIIIDKALDIHQLPHFLDGYFTVQDGAAQLAAELLAPEEGELILDGCAAPGGKTTHLLEIQPKLKKLVAIDSEEKRLQKVRDNLDRLELSAEIICDDITDLKWWNGELFDRILLDVPCSALGVIRRHPDIKLLRKPQDVLELKYIQAKILEAAWKILKPLGCLLYVTCSLLPDENEQVITSFINQHQDCVEQVIEANWGIARSVGRQILPGMYKGMDGFYFAKLIKNS